MNQEKIGKFILKCRSEKNMTQEELANIIGVTDRAISKWENGRGLPDLSLIMPLSDALGITVNELLSGEKLEREEYKEKSEKNIINTLDYSNKRIKHIKRIFIIFIILILVTLSCLFLIDVNRMRNNKPVLFSTWGVSYTPPLNIDEISVEKAIRDFLIKEEEKNSHYENEKTFVVMRTYLIKENRIDHYYLYSWVVEESYYKENDKIIKDTSSSIPYKFELIKNENEFEVKDYTIPRDGSYYEKDMKNIFPHSVLKDMNKVHEDGTVEKLLAEIQNDIELYYHN